MHIRLDDNECLIASMVSWRSAELGVQERRHTRKEIFVSFSFVVIAFISGFSDWFVWVKQKEMVR